MMEKGMNVKLEVCNVGHKKWRVILTCREFPEFNMIECVEDDKEMHMENAFYGKVPFSAAELLGYTLNPDGMNSAFVSEVISPFIHWCCY